MTRKQLDWLLGPEEGSKDFGEVGLLPLVVIPIVIFGALFALHLIAS